MALGDAAKAPAGHRGGGPGGGAGAPAGRPFELRAADGLALSACRFEAHEPRAVVVVGAALGVRQDFYADFAGHLAARGLDAITFDCRGIGRSAPRSLRGFRASLDDWIALDYEAAIAHAASAAGGRPVFVVGHSMGAQLPALAPSGRQVRAMVAVAGGGGYWGGLAPALRPLMLAMLVGVAPVAIPLAGYFPGRRLRLLGDLPAGVMRQWRRWCLHPEYLVGVQPGARDAYARVRFPILSLSFTDDRMMPQRNIDTLHAHFTGTARTARRLSPADAGGPIGHTGFFRRRYRDTLWPIVSDWLLERAAQARP